MLRKSGGAEYTGSRGSGALSAFPDIVVELTRFDPNDHKSRKRMLRAKGRYEETPDELIIELVDGEYRVIGDPGPEASAGFQAGGKISVRQEDTEEGRIIIVMRDNPDPWMQVEDIRKALKARRWGMRNDDVNSHLFSLYDRGRQVLIGGEVRSKTNPRKFALSSRSDVVPPLGNEGERDRERDEMGGV